MTPAVEQSEIDSVMDTIKQELIRTNEFGPSPMATVAWQEEHERLLALVDKIYCSCRG